ncbi:FMN-binding negative transcriptional regulator [Marivibrio halodurans]|uniref:FMN-binding negative transcriptional regulator n=1 Tax=Marivibrio halodurans TaxID=2039722 RepID=A0A8J7V3X4_9PROT|nr:FMN-binding negative transcriptional regulator [Marivibrio halodurans]MBP5858477.1 FMN-binding negative transcriptional regulator [Marivibrio halodurans]
MFTPGPFVMPVDRVRPHAARHDFAYLTIADTDPLNPPHAVQIPILLREADGASPAEVSPRLIGHVARANPVWHLFDGRRRARVLFPGPHAYIAPRWYAVPDHKAVPTWNYTAVEAVGAPRVIEDAEAAVAILRALSEAQEPEPGGWRPDGEAAGTVARMLAGIVAFEMPVERLSGKAKLSQNRSPADRAGVIEGLHARGDSEARAVAALMAALDSDGGSG